MAGTRRSTTKAADEAKSDEVTLTLSNPLTARYGPRLGLPVEEGTHPDTVIANVGEEVTVNRETARSIIAAGYAQVDPEDTAAVAEALGVEQPEGTIVDGQVLIPAPDVAPAGGDGS